MIRLSIRRPVAVAMAYFAFALLGVAAWRDIPIELLPNTEHPRLSISSSWRGASPETVEAFLTSRIEAEVQLIKGVEDVRSTSSDGGGSGRSQVEVDFNSDVDMDFVRLELSERMSALEEELPPSVSAITVTPYVPREFDDQRQPLLIYTFTGPYILEALRAHLDDVVVPELSQIEGVSIINVSGGRQRLLRIELDELEVTSLGLTPQQISSRLNDLDLVGEAGAIREGDQEYTITIQNRATSTRDLEDALIPTRSGINVKLGELARITDGFEEATQYNRMNSFPAVTMTVVKELGANSVEVAANVREAVDGLALANVSGSEFILQSDQSEEIKRQLTDLRSRALVSAVVIFVVLLLFLRSLKTAGIIFATIAFSVLISLNLIYWSGMSLNLLTLMGLAMGFGLIVDNSIVVLENVYRRWQNGEAAENAAERGSKQVVLPILASTATTVIVFVPFVYLQGDLKVYYFPLAIVVGFTLIASLFVAFTFIPALAAKILTSGSAQKMIDASGLSADSGMPALSLGSVDDPEPSVSRSTPKSPRKQPLYVRFYSDLVGFTLNRPILTIFFTALCFGGSLYIFDKYVDRGRLWGGGGNSRNYINVRIDLPRGADLQRTDELVRFFEEKLKAIQEIDYFASRVTGTNGNIQAFFPDSLDFSPIPPMIKEQMEAYSLGFTGAEVRVTGYGPSFYPGGGGAPNYSIKILGYNYEKVRDIAEDLGSRLSRQTRINDIDTNSSGRYSRDRATEYTIQVDRGALARYGLSVQQFVQRLGAVVRDANAGATVKLGGEDVNYEVKFSTSEELDVLDLQETIVIGPNAEGIRIGDVADIFERETLANIRRENQQYERTVSYEFRGPRKLGDLIRDAAVDATVLPPGYEIEETSGFRLSRDEELQIYLVLGISLLLIYMVTAALFESIRQPLAVLLTVPMALIGVFLMFFFAEATFTREAYIGVIMMGGIVVNNAILLVDHINQVRAGAKGSLADAILQGTLERVRPILMTTATTVIGLLPLVLFSQTADANIWNALAYALIGGLLSSTLFVLTTTPAVYYLFEKGKERRRLLALERDRVGNEAPVRI